MTAAEFDALLTVLAMLAAGFLATAAYKLSTRIRAALAGVLPEDGHDYTRVNGYLEQAEQDRQARP